MLLLKLFFAFIQVGMFSVGGGYAAIPLIQEQIVNIYGLMTLEEFSDLITVAEMTPGPISINSANVRRNADCRDSRCPALFDWMYHTILLHLSDPCTFLL